jgi:hypothetical protein
VSGRSVSLNWSASGTISNIVLEAGSSPGTSNVAALVLAPAMRSLADNAAPGVYYVRVRATNGCGTSAASNEVTVTVR